MHKFQCCVFMNIGIDLILGLLRFSDFGDDGEKV